MTSKEFGVLANVLKTLYPKENLFPNPEATEMWYGFLKDLDYQTASAAIQKWVSTSKWSPTIADIRQLSSEITMGQSPDWGDGYAEMRKAIGRYGYMNETEALESLSEITRATVRRMGWMNICMSENEDTQRANFRMIFEEVARRKREEAQMPKAVRDRINQLSDKLAPKQIGANE